MANSTGFQLNNICFWLAATQASLCHLVIPSQGQLSEGVEFHIYLYCFTFDDINLNRAFVILVLFPTKYSNNKVCANDLGK